MATYDGTVTCPLLAGNSRSLIRALKSVIADGVRYLTFNVSRLAFNNAVGGRKSLLLEQ